MRALDVGIYFLNMAATEKEFAQYLPAYFEREAWGVVVRGAGRITNAPGNDYPPTGHPSDHAFGWEHGRVLGAWQVVLIVAGKGEVGLERDAETRRVEAGDVILVVPGQWHRYRPAAETGWVEGWVEFEGTVPRMLTEAGVLPRRNEVRRVARGAAFGEAVAAIQRGVRGGAGGASEAELAALALQMLGLLAVGAGEANEDPRAAAMRKAKEMLAERLAEPPRMPALARAVGMDYAAFRREFRRRTGLAPRRYLLNLRLERAQRLLGATPLGLEAIAEETGFSSAFHLSAAFKRRYGVAPNVWRNGRG